jgi:uncharacterized protein YkvS
MNKVKIFSKLKKKKKLTLPKFKNIITFMIGLKTKVNI